MVLLCKFKYLRRNKMATITKDRTIMDVLRLDQRTESVCGVLVPMSRLT